MLAQVPKLGVSESGESFFGWTGEPRQRMDSPQMYDSTQHGHGGGGGGGGGGAGVGNGLGGGDMKKPPASSAAPGASLTTLSTSAGGAKQTAALLKQHHLQQQQQAYGAGAGGPHGADLSDLNTPEISLDLQNLIDDSQFGDGLFSDILQNPAVASAAGKHLPHALHTRHLGGGGGGGGGGSAYARTTLSYMPQPVHSGAAYQPPPANSDSNSSLGSDVPSIKEEPLEPHEYRRQCGAPAPPVIPGGYIPAYPAAAAFATLAPGGGLHAHHGAPGAPGKGRGPLGPTHPMHTHSGAHSPGGGARKPLKPTDKTSDEYRRRRERNNIAVRKSREKAKVRTRETEEKVKLLVKENERLQKRIELLTEELNVLRSLFSNVGVLPEQLHREINKHLDTFQQLQHQQHPSAHM